MKTSTNRTITTFSLGFVTGVGVGLFSRELIAGGGEILRPLVRNGIKGMISLVERGREQVAYWAESLSDLVAEAQADLTPPVPVVAKAAPSNATPAKSRARARQGARRASKKGS